MKNLAMLAPAAVLCISLSAPSLSADDHVGVEHLGPRNTLVRVNADSRYLLIPVEEAQEDVRINVLADGKTEQTLFCRLAKNKTDYTVPLDLSRFKGKEIVLNILAPESRSGHGDDVRDEACWSGFSFTDQFDSTNREKYRPAFHHTPSYGWMNDPNGMFYKDGVWHLYYQWNPYGSKWQNMTWGHSTSTDLLNWQHHPAAIEPDGLGAIFSGNSAIDRSNSLGAGNDAVVALYTNAADSQVQSLAVSRDNGMTFEKYAGNPVITLDSEARDPNIFWNDSSKEWVLVLAHALDHEILIYTSPDLKNWTKQSAFGKGLGAQNGVWECPDLFRLPVDGGKKSKWVLVVNLNPGGPFGGSATQYFTGEFDGRTFTPDLNPDGTVPTKWMDFGKDHYATVSFSDAPDSRRVLLGWMSNWEYANEVPTMQFRSANTLPRDASLFTGRDGRIYLASAPSPEVNALRLEPSVSENAFRVGQNPVSFALPDANDGICEIDLTIGGAGKAVTDITIANSLGEEVSISYSNADRMLRFDRTRSGMTEFSQSFKAVTQAPLLDKSKSLSLRIFIDRSSIEIFGNDGKIAMTNLVFPSSPYSSISFSGSGSEISGLRIYPLEITHNK